MRSVFCAVCVCARALRWSSQERNLLLKAAAKALGKCALAPSREMISRRRRPLRCDRKNRPRVYPIQMSAKNSDDDDRARVVRSRIERISRVRYNVCVVFAPSSKICEAKRRAIFVTWAFFANGIVFDERGESTWCYILFPKRSAFCNVSSGILWTRIPTPHTL